MGAHGAPLASLRERCFPLELRGQAAQRPVVVDTAEEGGDAVPRVGPEREILILVLGWRLEETAEPPVVERRRGEVCREPAGTRSAPIRLPQPPAHPQLRAYVCLCLWYGRLQSILPRSGPGLCNALSRLATREPPASGRD